MKIAKLMTFAILFLSPAFAQAATTNISGQWEFNINGSKYNVTIDQSGRLINGTMQAINVNEAETQFSGAVSGNTVTFTRDITFVEHLPQHYVGYLFELNTNNDTMAGTLSDLGTHNEQTDQFGWYATKSAK